MSRFFPTNFSQQLNKRIALAVAKNLGRQAHYQATHITPAEFGHRTGPIHAASILSWIRLAEIANIPHIPVEVVAVISMVDAWSLTDCKPQDVSPRGSLALAQANAYCQAGGFWRTEICAGIDVKVAMAEGLDLPEILPFNLADSRLLELHASLPTITVVGRPRLTPVRVNGYPVEFRTFWGGKAQEAAVSYYYPQAGEFPLTPVLEAHMSQAQAWGETLYRLRAELGLIPWVPEDGEPDSGIGATIDFMLTEEAGLVLVDAGPGYGYGAHPCCFIDTPVSGRRWQLASGVAIR